MNGYNFTENVRRVLAAAREEATHLHHEYVGTEHMLLALLRRGEGAALKILEELQVDADSLPAKIEAMLKPGTSNAGPDLPYSNRAKTALELSMKEARELGHEYVGTEHLLLGLVREEKGVAAQVLGAAGVTLDAARAKTLELVGSPTIAWQHRSTPAPTPADRREPTLIVIEVRYDGGWTHRREFRTAGEAMAFLAAR